MKLLYKIKFDILISTKTLFFIKTSYNVPVRNESISQSKICKKTLFCVVFNQKEGLLLMGNVKQALRATIQMSSVVM